MTKVLSKHHKAKLTPYKVRVIRTWLTRGILQRKIARHFGVSQSTVSMIARKITWRHE